MYGIYDTASQQTIARFAAPMTVRSNKPVFVSDTLSLSRKVSARSAQRWEIETRLEPLSATANELFTDLVTSGHFSTTKVLMPQNYGVIENLASTSSVTSGSHNAGASTIGFGGVKLNALI